MPFETFRPSARWLAPLCSAAALFASGCLSSDLELEHGALEPPPLPEGQELASLDLTAAGETLSGVCRVFRIGSMSAEGDMNYWLSPECPHLMDPNTTPKGLWWEIPRRTENALVQQSLVEGKRILTQVWLTPPQDAPEFTGILNVEYQAVMNVELSPEIPRQMVDSTIWYRVRGYTAWAQPQQVFCVEVDPSGISVLHGGDGKPVKVGKLPVLTGPSVRYCDVP